jgi:ABC-type amino acid transport substrate-binding protein
MLGLRLGFAGASALIVTIASAATAGAQAIDPAVLAQLAPTGKLRVGVAAGLTPGTGNVAIAPGAARPQGIGADLGAVLGTRLVMAVEWVTYPNSDALTEAGTTGAWDVAFMPVDEERKQKLDFGAAHIVLQSTWMVGPGSPIRTLADVEMGRRVKFDEPHRDVLQMTLRRARRCRVLDADRTSLCLFAGSSFPLRLASTTIAPRFSPIFRR